MIKIKEFFLKETVHERSFFFNFSFYKLTILSFSYFLSEWRAFVTTCCRKAIQSRQPLRLINCFWSKWLHSPATYFLSFAAIRLKLGCCSMLSFNPSSMCSLAQCLFDRILSYYIYLIWEKVAVEIHMLLQAQVFSFCWPCVL